MSPPPTPEQAGMYTETSCQQFTVEMIACQTIEKRRHAIYEETKTPARKIRQTRIN